MGSKADRIKNKKCFDERGGMMEWWGRMNEIESAALDAALEMAGNDPAERQAVIDRYLDKLRSEPLPKPRKTGRARRPGQISRTIRLPEELVLATRSAAVRAGVSWSGLMEKFAREGLRNER